MKARKWVLVFVSILVFSGCSYVQEYREIIRADAVSKGYFNTLNRYTREKTLYAEFETRVRIVATWKSRTFADAYLAEYDRLYLLTDKDREERKGVLSEVSSDFNEFLFYAYTPDRESNDFSRTGSIWKVFSMSQGNAQVEPLEVREIEATPLVKKLFPYVKPYGKCYSVKFPLILHSGRSDREDHLKPTLVFAGILGKVELTWR